MIESQQLQERRPVVTPPNTATFGMFTLSSAFQPIISIPHRRAVGYEALIRPKDEQGKSCSPEALFQQAKDNELSLSLDRSCRALHIENFSRFDINNKWLFLNIDSQSLTDEKPTFECMTNVLKESQVNADQLVIEILEHEILDRSYLKEMINHFRSLGCLIAIDDFGAGHSNFERIWELEPDIVKLDRNLVTQAAKSPKLKRILKGIISLIHSTGCLVVLEGIETKDEAVLAIEVNADMVQGFYFATPDAHISLDPTLDQTLSQLLQIQSTNLNQDHNVASQRFKLLSQRFLHAIELFIANLDLQKSTTPIFKDPRAARCFLLDEEGYQIGTSIHSPNYEQQLNNRFGPLLESNNAKWSQKHYHYRAIRSPEQLQVSRPYLSATDLRLCITVSIAIKVNRAVYVYCCDLNWQENEPL